MSRINCLLKIIDQRELVSLLNAILDAIRPALGYTISRSYNFPSILLVYLISSARYMPALPL